MVRSLAAAAALAILPGITLAQQPATHQVVDGETLWELAGRYYDNPYLWPRIYEANRGVVEDPHWIYPGEELVIPDVTGAVVGDVAVVTGEDPRPPAEPAVEPGAVPPATGGPVQGERTVFWQPEGRGFSASEDMGTLASVPREVHYSAEWLIPEDSEPESVGVLGELQGAGDERARRTTYFRYDLIQLRGETSLPVGTPLLAYRVVSEVEGVGRVARPTGVVSVSQPAAGGAVALVVDVFDRMQAGDLVRPLGSYDPRPGVRPLDVSGGQSASIIAFANPHAVQSVGDRAFLDRGSRRGVQVGDEFALVFVEEPGWPATVEGRLQVVRVEPGHSTARIVQVRNPVFAPGVEVELVRRLP